MASIVENFFHGERTGFRDQWMSGKHRKWGIACKAVDIDLLLVEYGAGEPKGIIEYKFYRWLGQVLDHPQLSAIRLLCDRYAPGALPFFVVRYWRNAVFEVIPVNDAAKKYYAKATILSELEYVRLLYRIRGISLDTTLELSTSMEPDEAA